MGARRWWPLLAAWWLSGCFYSPVQVLPSLTPMDASQPMVRYRPIQGSACESYVFYSFGTGGDPLRDAMWEMKRLLGVDGYVEVTIEERVYGWLFGYTKCVTVTGYPVTYGTEPRELQLRGEATTQRPVGGGYEQPREQPPARTAPDSQPTPPTRADPNRTAVAPPTPGRSGGPTPLQCSVACDKFGKLAGTTPIIQQVVTDKCAERCGSGDRKYYECANRARNTSDVKRCNALPR